MDKIITASDRHGSVKNMITRLSRATRSKMPDINDISGSAVIARVNLGRWVADCQCGGCELVDPDQPVFFCFSCGNILNGGKVRLVKFPRSRKSIERELLKRKANAVGDFIVALPGELPREWIPSETVEDLKTQRESRLKI